MVALLEADLLESCEVWVVRAKYFLRYLVSYVEFAAELCDDFIWSNKSYINHPSKPLHGHAGRLLSGVQYQLPKMYSRKQLAEKC